MDTQHEFIQLTWFIVCIVGVGCHCYKRNIVKALYWLALSLLASTLIIYAKLLEIQNVVTTISRQ